DAAVEVLEVRLRDGEGEGGDGVIHGIETACALLFTNAVAKAPPIRPAPMTTIFFMLFLGLRLADTVNNESVIDCPLLAVLRDTLIGFAVIPILGGFHGREFRNDDSLDRIAFKDFMLSIGDEHFDRMTLHRCSDSRPICFELFLIDGLRSREYNVCRHDCSPVLLSNYSRIALVSRNASIPYLPYSRPMPE